MSEDELPELREGDTDRRGRQISRMFVSSENYLVYEVENAMVRWCYVDKSLAPLIAQISPELTRVAGYLRVSGALRCEVGRAVAEAFEGREAAAREILQEVERKALYFNGIVAKLRYLSSAAALMLLLTLFSVSTLALDSYLTRLDTRFAFLLYVATCGSLGGFLSVSLNLQRLDLDPEAPRSVHITSGLSRIVIAVIGALFVYLLIEANILFGIAAKVESKAATLAVSVLAGFSETLIPNLLRKMEHKGKPAEPNSGQP